MTQTVNISAQRKPPRRRRRAISPEETLRLRKERQILKEHLVKWLSVYPFQLFITVTFKPPDRGKRPHHSFEFCQWNVKRLWAAISRMIYGRQWKRRGNGLYGIQVWERHVSGAWHLHALVMGDRDQRDPQWVPWFKDVHDFCKEDKYLGHIWIDQLQGDEELRSKRVNYVTKYISKRLELWELLGVRSLADPELVKELRRDCAGRLRPEVSSTEVEGQTTD